MAAPGWLKLNLDVAIQLNGPYIAISIIDFSNSVCIVYIERLVAINLPFFGEAFTLTKATILAKKYRWNHIVFECDSLVLCRDVLSHEQPQHAATSTMVAHIRNCLEEFNFSMEDCLSADEL